MCLCIKITLYFCILCTMMLLCFIHCEYCIIWELSVFSSTLMLNISCGYSCFHLMYLLQGHVLDCRSGEGRDWPLTISKLTSPPSDECFGWSFPPLAKFQNYSFLSIPILLPSTGARFSLKLISLNLCKAKTQVSFSFNDDMAFSGLRLQL